MEFLDLNVDVLGLIFDYLPRKDIKALRLTNKALKSLAKFTIPRLFLSPNRTNIDVFRSVLDHEGFKTQVQEIVWDDGRLESYSSDSRFSREQNGYIPDRELKSIIEVLEDNDMQSLQREYPVLEQRKEELWGTNAEEISLLESCQIYLNLWDEQYRIMETGEDVIVFRRGLLELPNLRRVTLTSEAWRLYPLFPLYETPFFRSLKPGMRMPYPWPWLGQYSASEYDEPGNHEQLMTPWDQPHEEWRGYTIIVSELLSNASHHNVCEFVVDVHREATGISQQLFCSPNLDLTNTEALFQKAALTRLELALNMEGMGTGDPDAWDNAYFWTQPFLKRALSYLGNLKHFHLHLSPMEEASEIWWESSATPWITLQNILPTPHETAWPHLQHLGFANIITTEDSLFELLATLPALTDVDLDSLELCNHNVVARGEACSLLTRIKTSLVDSEEGAWKTRHPRWTLRYANGIENNRTTYYNDIIGGYLYGNLDNPFSPLPPGALGKKNIAWRVDDFEEEYTVPDGVYTDEGTEWQEQQRFKSLLLYPPPLVPYPK